MSAPPAGECSQAPAPAPRSASPPSGRRERSRHPASPSPGATTASSTPATAESSSATAATASSDPSRRRCGRRPPTDWDADGEFIPGSDEEGGGRWQFARPVPREGWELSWEEVRFRAQATPFRHLAFFPDMAPQWAWMRERLRPGTEALNLFGYTGVGTLALSAAGASLVHVDASKKSVEAGKENAGCPEWPTGRSAGWSTTPPSSSPARCAAAAAMTASSSTRPNIGRGPTGEIWRLEEGLPGLIADCRRLLDADSRFLVLTVYAVRMSALAIGELLKPGARPTRRHDRDGRHGGPRGSARPAASDRHLRAVEPLSLSPADGRK